jgi:hypothetical protein
MNRVWLFGLAAASALAQGRTDLFTQAPPAIDQALRARIAAFYQAHVDGKFREAEKLVAEDTKDFFYNANKPRYLSFAIEKIAYAEDFTRAKATVLCEMYVAVPGFLDKPLKVPTPSLWKLENGQWVWYIDQEALKTTPFGVMKPGPAPAAGSAPSTPPNVAAMDMKQMLAKIQQVKLDHTAVEIKSGESAQVAVSNHLPGSATLQLLVPKIDGLTAVLDRSSLNAGDKAVVTIRNEHSSGTPPPATITVRVEQTGQLLPIRVTFLP